MLLIYAQVWALALVDFNPDPTFMRPLIDALAARVSDCIPMELANVVWSLAKLNCYDGFLMDKFANQAVSRIEDFAPLPLVCFFL